MISVDEAWQRIKSLATPLPVESTELDQAEGRVLAEDVNSAVDLPPFDNSAMDGYALRSTDSVDADEKNPVSLELIGEVAAGRWPKMTVESGTAVQIMTGAPLPAGADTVLRLEDGRLRQARIELRKPLEPGVHVRHRGEDAEAGRRLLAASTELNVQRLGLLANSGISQVIVHQRPKLRLLATGSELVLPSENLEPGQIYDANSTTMKELAKGSHCDYQDLGIAGDSADLIRKRVESATDCQILMISGGVSVGKYDYVKTVLKDLGMETVFWRVKIKPGKPLLCGRIGDCWVFGLPGNPISCVVGFLVFIAPLIRLIQSQPDPQLQLLKARLTAPVRKRDDRRHFMTAITSVNSEGQLQAKATEKQGSAMMYALATANSFIVVPEECDEIAAGELVDVLPIGHYL